MREKYLHRLVFSIVLLTLACEASGNQLSDEWNKTFGGHYSDGAWSIQKTADSGFILAGYTASKGEGCDLYLIKTDSEGNAQWNKTFGGPAEDVGYSVFPTIDGNYVVVGTTRSYGIGEERLWLLKIDSNGTMLWDHIFGGFVTSSGDGGWAIIQTKDGGYIVTGYATSKGFGAKDLWLIKTDADGNKLWDMTYGGPRDDVGMSLVQTNDEGFIVTGRTASFGSGGDDIWLLKVNPEGKEQWNKTFGGKKDDVCFQILQLKDGFILVGRTESYGSEIKKAILIKTDLLGNKQWEKVYEEDSAGLSLQQTADGGFIIAGHIDSEDSGRDALIIKTDSSGSEEWAGTLGGPGDDIGTSIVENQNGDYLLAGITNSYGAGAEDAWLVKIPSHPYRETFGRRNITIMNKTITPENISIYKSPSKISTKDFMAKFPANIDNFGRLRQELSERS